MHKKSYGSYISSARRVSFNGDCAEQILIIFTLMHLNMNLSRHVYFASCDDSSLVVSSQSVHSK